MSVREDLLSVFVNSQKVNRFTGNDLPSGVVQDTVFSHTLRGIALAGLLRIPVYLVAPLQETVFIHDLPEVVDVIANGKVGDTTSPEKELNKLLEGEISSREMQIAKAIFTPEELSFYESFEEAGCLLKNGGCNNEHLTDVAVLAQMVDKVDANITLHFYLSNWAETFEYDESLVNPDRSLTFFHRQYFLFKENLRYVENDFIREAAHDLLKSQNEFIRERWREVVKKGVQIPKQLGQLI